MDETVRFLDLNEEPIDLDQHVSPIDGYEIQPILPLLETIKPISHLFKQIESYAKQALDNCQKPSDSLTQDESAAIYLYTMQFRNETSLYTQLNHSLRTEIHDQVQPWFSYLKLFLTALHKLPSMTGTIFRGVKGVHLTSEYKTKRDIFWWGVSSCTKTISLMESELFLGKNGLRTLISIESINGKSITNHSHFKHKEDEVILMPGTHLQLIGKTNPSTDLFIIQLREVARSARTSLLKSRQLSIPKVSSDARWSQNGFQINPSNELFHSWGMTMDEKHTIYVADTYNHRILKCEIHSRTMQVVLDQKLDHPVQVLVDEENDCLIISDHGHRRVIRWSRQDQTIRDILISNIDCWGLAMDKNNYLYVSDIDKHEVRRYRLGESQGTIVAGGNGEGNRCDQLNQPRSIFIDHQQSIYVSDCRNHRIMKWNQGANKGILVAGGHEQGDRHYQLSYPNGLFVDTLDTIYIADCSNHRIIRWIKDSKQGQTIIGDKGYGHEPNQLFCPTDLLFDREYNLYVLDCNNHRIQRYEIDD